MGETESPLKQELGPKKFNEKVEKSNKFYDKYKAGKRDPKTGELYHHINYTNPNKRTKLGSSLCTIACHSCERPLSIKTSTVIIKCSYCSCIHRVNYNRLTEELSIDGFPEGKG